MKATIRRVTRVTCLISILSILVPGFLFGGPKYFSVMQWNVENLFDAVHAPGKDDEEFTPGGAKHWTPDKLKAKLENLTRVIRTINYGKGPSVITLAEVENIEVMRQWCKEEMPDLHYTPVLIQGPDVRGINVAVLTQFPLKTQPISFNVSDPTVGKPTRDALLVTLDLEGIPFYILVNHWPSRLGGAYAEKYRFRVAQKLRGIVAQILQKDPDADVLVSGDFNDETEDLSFLQGLQTTWEFPKLLDPRTLYVYPVIYESINLPLMMQEYEKKHGSEPGYDPVAYEAQLRKVRGTLYYGKEKRWYDFDHIMLNANLFDNKRVSYERNSFRTVREPMMMNSNGVPKGCDGDPKQCYSDHFPVIARFAAHYQ